MNYCNNCGTKFDGSENFCHDCGTERTKKETKRKKQYFEEGFPAEEVVAPKRRIWPWLLVLLIVGGVVGGAGLLFFDAVTTGGAITGSVIGVIQPPRPTVVDVDCSSYGSGFLDMDSRMKVEVTVQNKGGGGNVRVIGKLDQSDTAFDASDTKIVYIGKNQVQTVTFDFDSSGFRNAKCLGYAYAS